MRWPPSGLQKPGHVELWIRDTNPDRVWLSKTSLLKGYCLNLESNSNKAEFVYVCLLTWYTKLYRHMGLIQSKSPGTRDLQMTQHFQKDSALQPTPPSANLFHSWQTDLHPASIYNKSEHEPTPHKSTTKSSRLFAMLQIKIDIESNKYWSKPSKSAMA